MSVPTHPQQTVMPHIIYTWTVNAQVLKHISHNLRADSITTYNIYPEISTTSNTHAARENLPRLVVLRNLFAIIIVFSHSTALPFLGKISEGNQARYILLHGNLGPTLDNYYTLMNLQH